MDQLKQWQGEFGSQYIERNVRNEETTRQSAAVFQRILDASCARDVKSVLEVGANIGINLSALRRVLGRDVELAALEPNAAAVQHLQSSAELGLNAVFHSDAAHIPAPDGAYDLVFTSGVLIHVAPDQLAPALAEICRVARRYVLAVEYFSHQPAEIPYRGQLGLMWKRDYGADYLQSCPSLKPHQYGFIWQQEFPHFDNLNWWMLKKTG